MGMESKQLARKMHFMGITHKGCQKGWILTQLVHNAWLWSREEIRENRRLEKHKASSDTPAVADQWNRHPCCHESGAESGQTASAVLLWFIFSWVVFSLVPGALCLALLLLRRCSCTKDLSFALLCPHLVLSHWVFALVHSSILLDMNCQHCPCAPTAFLSPAACLKT